MKVTRNGSKPSVKGPTDWFTGAVRIDSGFQAEDDGRSGGAIVTFETGARTHWHTPSPNRQSAASDASTNPAPSIAGIAANQPSISADQNSRPSASMDCRPHIRGARNVNRSWIASHSCPAKRAWNECGGGIVSEEIQMPRADARLNALLATRPAEGAADVDSREDMAAVLLGTYRRAGYLHADV